MLRTASTMLVTLGLITSGWAQENIPLTEPTNRPIPPKLATSGVYSFCPKDQSLAFAAGDEPALIHQLFSLNGTSAQPLELGGPAREIAISPNGKSLAAIADKKVFVYADRMKDDATPVGLAEEFEVRDQPSLIWSANSNALFVIDRGSPASALRISLDGGNESQAISFKDGRHFFASPSGDLMVAFNRDGAEIWRGGSESNKTVTGRTEAVFASPDGRFLAFMADDNLQVWTLSPLGKGASVAAYGADFVQFSADGKRLLVFEVDDKAKCYEVGDKGQLTLLKEYEATNGCGWISEDGNLGACFSYSDSSRLMRVFRCDRNAETEVPIITKSPGLGGYDPDIFPNEYQLSQDGRRGLVAWPGGRIEMFDVASGLSDWGCRVPDLAKVWLVAKGDRILTIDKLGSLQLHDTSVGRIKRKAVTVEKPSTDGKHFGDTPFRFQELADGKHCAVWCGSKLREFTIVELSTGKVVGRAKDTRDDGEHITGWRSSDDGSVICVVGKRVRLLKTGFTPGIPSTENAGRFHLAVKATGVKEPVHGIYDTKTGQMRRTLRWEFVDGTGFRLRGHVSRDGQLCALAGKRLDRKGKGVEVRSTKTGKQLFTVPLPEADFSWLDFTRDQTGMWVVTREALMRLDFETKTLEPFFSDKETQTDPVKPDPKAPTPLADSNWQMTQFECFSESGTGWIATGHRRGFVNIWSTKDKQRYGFLRCGTERVEALAFSPDGRFLLSWCADRNKLQVTDLSSILPAVPPAPAAGDDLNLDF